MATISKFQRRFQEIAPDYYAALLELGDTHEARAERLGVTLRHFTSYLMGRSFPAAHILKSIPELDAAYTKNFAAILPLVKRREGRRPIEQAA